MAHPRESFVGSRKHPGPGRLTFLNTQPKRGLIPGDRVYTRVMILIERQKCEHGPKPEGGKKRPQEGSSEHPIMKQEIRESEKEREGRKGISESRAGGLTETRKMTKSRGGGWF